MDSTETMQLSPPSQVFWDANRPYMYDANRSESPLLNNFFLGGGQTELESYRILWTDSKSGIR